MKTDNETDLLFKELNGNPYRRLNLSFFLISIIPILSLVYVLCDKLLIGNKTFDNMSLILSLAGIILVLGYIVAYGVVRNIVNKALLYAAKSKRADELKSAFAISLAHDLKSPLMTIKANISNLKAGFLGTLTSEQNGAIDVCRETSNRMNTMIMELIDTYMIEARMAELKPSLFDLRHLLEEQARELASTASAKNVSVSLELPSAPLPVKADREKILRAVNNIFNNSIKYALTGGKVRINARLTDSLIRIEFQNDGAPIAADNLEKIFDKFERLDTAVEGHGLGLAIARDIIELHHGKVWADSQAGTLNCFTILLKSNKE